jgi:hypothetical protein
MRRASTCFMSSEPLACTKCDENQDHSLHHDGLPEEAGQIPDHCIGIRGRVRYRVQRAE